MNDEHSNPDVAWERTGKLPEEILKAHRTRADFLKWKLILVAALGAAGFGLGEKSQPVRLLLALIPLVCIYADLLCTNLKVRVIVIGTFYADLRGDIYERYTQRNRSVFQTEDWALYYSTYVVCFLLVGLGLFSKTFEGLSWQWVSSWQWLDPAQWPWHHPAKEDALLMFAGLLGFGLSLYTNAKSKRLIETLSARADSHEVQSLKLGGLLRAEYTATQLQALASFLMRHRVFLFKSLPNGLFPAAASVGAKDVSGYQYVWVRDNVHVAHAHYVCGDTASAARALSALMKYFQKHQGRFSKIIDDQEIEPKKRLAANPMNRPHIRFDGRELKELDQQWGHAQNDALGYFLWCYCKLVRDDVIHPDNEQLRCLALFPLYFEAIQYWRDPDNGHWEETPKVEASSIGVVLAGLREFEQLTGQRQDWADLIQTELKVDADRLKRLRKEGEAALQRILPCESTEPEECYRRYDSALLFLIYPLEVVEWEQAKIILEDIRTHLEGAHGIRRYLGDSYWFPDYKKVPAWKRTGDFSGSMEERNAGVQLGQEAQWCLFDPIISVIYGRMHRRRKEEGKAEEARDFLELQTAYFNRSVSQLAPGPRGAAELKAPEAYYLEDGHYVPNDHTPLLWSQANLWLAVHQMTQSLTTTKPATLPGVQANPPSSPGVT